MIGRRVFDLTNGWDGKPAAGEHVFVVTHEPPTDWEYADTAPFTFVDGVEQAIAAAKEFAGDRDVDVAAGQIGGQALKLGLIDQVVVSLVPVVFGSGRPFFATGALAEPLLLQNPSVIVQGDRVTHLVYDVDANRSGRPAPARGLPRIRRGADGVERDGRPPAAGDRPLHERGRRGRGDPLRP